MTVAGGTATPAARIDAAAMTAGTLVGPAGGTWQLGTADLAYCAVGGCRVDHGPVWRYWLTGTMTATVTVCPCCAEAL